MAEGYEYSVSYVEKAKAAGRLENVIGWYHSHPGYGCWLSGIDVATQKLNQTFTEPWLALVIDPNRSISSGKVDIGAFRTYPEGYTPSDSVSEYQSIPLNKIEDYGVHAKAYYSLDISYFQSGLDDVILKDLWNKYWIQSLSTSPMVTNADYTSTRMVDLAAKIEKAENTLSMSSRTSSKAIDRHESPLDKVSIDAISISQECSHGFPS